MKKNIKSLFCSLSAASVLLFGCAGISDYQDYSCYATGDSLDMYNSSSQGEMSEENQEYSPSETSNEEKFDTLTTESSQENAEQSDSEKSTEEVTATKSAETTESVKPTEAEKDDNSEKASNNIISILLFVVGIVCGFTIAYAFIFISNEKRKKEQLKKLKSLSMEIENVRIKVKELDAAANELTKLSYIIKKADNTMKSSEKMYK